jgi:hypothetical protein
MRPEVAERARGADPYFAFRESRSRNHLKERRRSLEGLDLAGVDFPFQCAFGAAAALRR